MYSSSRIQNLNQNFQGHGFSNQLNYTNYNNNGSNNNMATNGFNSGLLMNSSNGHQNSMQTNNSFQSNSSPMYSSSNQSLLGPAPVSNVSNGSSISNLMTSNNSPLEALMSNNTQDLFASMMINNSNSFNNGSNMNSDLQLIDQSYMSSNINNGNSLLGTPLLNNPNKNMSSQLNNKFNNNNNLQPNRHNSMYNKNPMINNINHQRSNQKNINSTLCTNILSNNNSPSSTNNKKIHLQVNDKCSNVSNLQKAMEANKRNINQSNTLNRTSIETTLIKSDSIEVVCGNNLKRSHSSLNSNESILSDQSDTKRIETDQTLSNEDSNCEIVEVVQKDINKKVCTKNDTYSDENNSSQQQQQRIDSCIVAVNGLLNSSNSNEDNFEIKVNAFYCKACSIILNDDSGVKQHLYTVLHRNKLSTLLKTNELLND